MLCGERWTEGDERYGKDYGESSASSVQREQGPKPASAPIAQEQGTKAGQAAAAGRRREREGRDGDKELGGGTKPRGRIVIPSREPAVRSCKLEGVRRLSRCAFASFLPVPEKHTNSLSIMPGWPCKAEKKPGGKGGNRDSGGKGASSVITSFPHVEHARGGGG